MSRRAAAAALAALLTLLWVTPAWAAPTTEVIQGSVLRLVSVADWEAASNQRSGDPVRWDVAISADSPEPGTVSVGVSARGEAPLMLDASLCLQDWRADECPGGATVLRTGWEVPRDGAEVVLAKVSDTQVAHLRLSVRLGPGDDDGRTDLRVHAQGSNESVVVGPDGGLAATGMSLVVSWILGARAALLVLGGALVWARCRDRDDGEGPA